MNKNASQNLDCHQLFVRGDYAAVIKEFFDRPEYKLASSDLPWIVGSLCFTGRLTEAEALYRQNRPEDPVAACASRYFLAIAHLRHNSGDSNRSWLEASALLIENIKAVRQAKRRENDCCSTTIPLLDFYAAQGIGFTRYRSGRLKQALYWAEKAQMAAVAADFLFGRVFSGDLLGHVRVNIGQVRRGFREFERITSLAEALGQGAIVQGIAATLAIYRARFGITTPEVADDELKQRIAQCRFEDSYTLASLHLERACLSRLTGRTSDERASLDAAMPLIFSVKSPHLEAQLNIRLALPLLQSGNARQALDMMRHSLTEIQPNDIAIALKLHGIEYRSLLALGKLSDAEAVLAEINRLTRRSGQRVALRVLNRANDVYQSDAMRGDDPLGDLIDESRRRPKTDQLSELRRKCANIIASGWTGLLYETLKLPLNSAALVFDLEYGALTLFDHGDVVHLSGGISTLGRRFVEALATGPKSKEQLIASVWQLRYHPLKHDSLIYALVAKLRRTLGLRSDWIQATEDGYRLPANASVLSTSIESNATFAVAHQSTHESSYGLILESPRSIAVSSADSNGVMKPHSAMQPPLNQRQIAILRVLNRGEYFDVQRGMTEFGASDATISRDLTQLLSLGLVERIGKGRATKYRLKEQTPAEEIPQ